MMRLAFIFFLLVGSCQAATKTISGNLFFGTPTFVSVTNSEAIAYGNNITNQGGVIQYSDLVAVDAFVGAAKGNGYWDYITDCSPLAGENATSAKMKLKSHANAQRTNLLAIGSGAYVKARGFYCTNGAAFWPGIVTSNTMLSAYSNGAALWVTDFVSTTNSRGWVYGTENSGSNERNYLFFGSVTANFDIEVGASLGGNGGNGAISVSSLMLGQGMISHSRTGLSLATIFVNGAATIQTADTITPAADANAPWGLGARFGGTAPPTVADSLYGSLILGYYALDSGIPYSMQTNYARDVSTLMSNLGRKSARTYSRKAVIISGQSNSYGEGAVADDFRYSIFGNLLGGSTAFFFRDTATTNYFRLRGTAAEYGKHSGWMAGMEQLSSMSRSNGVGATNDSIYMSFGKNGINIGQYNGLDTDPFIRSTNWTKYQNDLETNLYTQPLSFPAVFVVGGESDGGNGAFGTSLELMRLRYTTNVPVANSTMGIFTSQHGAYATGETPENLAMLTNQETTAYNYLVMSKYQLPYTTDNIHLTGPGYTRMGEKYGEALYYVLTRGWWEPLRPIALIVTNNTQLLCVFTNTGTQLAFDTNVTWLTNKTNAGFVYSDSDVHTISSVALNSTNCVLITLSGNITASTSRLLSYGVNSGTNSIYCAGTPQGPGGTLRNNAGAVGFTSGLTNNDWCVVFKKSIPYP